MKAIYSKFVQDSSGNADPSASYEVINEVTGLPVTIYEDFNATQVKAPPHFAESGGLIRFYFDPGLLIRVEISGAGGSHTDRHFSGILAGSEVQCSNI